MDRRVVTTGDGSHSLRIDEWDEQYHSKHGAIAESRHVFIKNGLYAVERPEVDILEMGFGTGLNAFLTLLENTKRGFSVRYTGIEAYPLRPEEWNNLNFPEVLQASAWQGHFYKMHSCDWNGPVSIHEQFQLTKYRRDIKRFVSPERFDLVYFDAFGYRVQPELWSASVFQNMFRSLRPGGKLVTYAAKGIVRRTMASVGFRVERLPGPPGKREMLRAHKD